MWAMRLLCVVVLLIYGVFCQTFFSTPIQKCPGDDITFTCVVMDTSGVGTTTWNVTIPAGESSTCEVRHNLQGTETCGPNGEFSSSEAVENGDNYTSTLSVSDDFNGTTVECLDQALSKVGSENICTVGPVMDPPQFLPAIISEYDVTVNECVVTLEWNEPFISCNGSVSQYVLTVTPPTSDCQSGSGDCVLMTDQTQYNLTVTVDQMYSLTVRADTCRNMQIGENSSDLTLELGGSITSCDALYKYSPSDGSLQATDITWTPVHSSLSEEVKYTVVIDDGVGSVVRERVTSPDCTSTQCSYTYYPAESSSKVFGVSVEATGCVTRQTVCTERPVYCSLSDLSPSLVEVNRVCGSVSGGRVCYSGDSVGSVAVYFCNDDYKLEGDSTRECLSSGLWNGTIPHCVQETMAVCNACSDSTAVIVGVVCSLMFLSAGVLLGVVTVYLILRARGKLSGPTSLSPPPLPPPVTYEEVGVSEEVKSTHNIHLQSNEAYGPIQRDNIHTSPNTAYGQVRL